MYNFYQKKSKDLRPKPEKRLQFKRLNTPTETKPSNTGVLRHCFNRNLNNRLKTPTGRIKLKQKT